MTIKNSSLQSSLYTCLWELLSLYSHLGPTWSPLSELPHGFEEPHPCWDHAWKRGWRPGFLLLKTALCCQRLMIDTTDRNALRRRRRSVSFNRCTVGCTVTVDSRQFHSNWTLKNLKYGQPELKQPCGLLTRYLVEVYILSATFVNKGGILSMGVKNISAVRPLVISTHLVICGNRKGTKVSDRE